MPLSRRDALLATGALALTGCAATGSQPTSRAGQLDRTRDPVSGDRPRTGPVAIASGNGLETVRLAVEAMQRGTDPAVAAVQGVAPVEADPNDMSVGLGGLPDERGVVTLDSAVMHGPTHKAGSVAALEDTLHPAQVALKVLQTTDHVMLVGEGAERFARLNGFPHADLLTDKAREAWLRWKRSGSKTDDWLDVDEWDWDPELSTAIPHTTGTIHCSCVDGSSDIGCCTTTSGLSYKIQGRVGDSPIIGAGLYCDNDIGSAGGTGRGEAAIQACASFSVVQHMGAGMNPTDACLATLEQVARNATRKKRLTNDRGQPNFNLVLYAVAKDGRYGSACMRGRRQFAVADATGARRESCVPLYE
ncbi:MAG: N(4)-(beta-N-acetylglucosaminyl)-L-asparaginase [Planctomycetota bacterium]